MAKKYYPCCDNNHCPLCWGTGVALELDGADLADAVSTALDWGDMNNEDNRRLVRQLVLEFTSLLYKPAEK